MVVEVHWSQIQECLCVVMGYQQREGGREESDDPPPHLRQLTIHHWNSGFSGHIWTTWKGDITCKWEVYLQKRVRSFLEESSTFRCNERGLGQCRPPTHRGKGWCWVHCEDSCQICLIAQALRPFFSSKGWCRASSLKVYAPITINVLERSIVEVGT